MVLGAIVGTFVFLQYGIKVSLALTGVMFFGSALVLSLLPRDLEEQKPAEVRDFTKEMMAGLRYLWSNHSLRTLSATFAATGLAAGMIQPLMLFISIEKLGQDKQFLQWLLMSNGTAMLIGGVVIMGIAKKVKPQVLLATGLLVSAVCTIGVGASTIILQTIALQLISGLFYPCIQIGIQTLIMKNTEGAFIGRVGGAITPIFMGMMVMGMSLSGYLKDMLSLFTVYTVSGGLLLIGTLLLAPLIQKKRKFQN